MNFIDFKRYFSRLDIGKKLSDSLYIHKNNLYYIDNRLSTFIIGIQKDIDASLKYNVIKIFLYEFKISFLYYPKFFEIPHPILHRATFINLSTGRKRRYNYSQSDNPPILHRKEFLLEPNNSLIPKFYALTKAEKAAGLFDKPLVIGFKKNWEQLLKDKGLGYE